MTKDKDFKEQVRTRMAKTRESYTTARRNLLAAAGSADGSEEVSAQDDAEWVAAEASRAGIRVVQESSGRWAARTSDPDRVAYGETALSAQKRLLEAIWEDDMDWRNQVDDDTASYLSLQDN